MGTTISLCSSPAASLKALSELFEWADELRLAYAWATSDDGDAKHWKALPLAKVKQAIIGIHFAQTEPAALRALLGCGAGILKVVGDTGDVFHPKVIVGLTAGRAKALVGSSNFTNGGFAGNTELNVLLEGAATERSFTDLMTFLDDQWTHPRAREPDEAWLRRYERAYDARPRPKPVRKGSSGGNKQLIKAEADLHIDWGEYYSLIVRQEQRTLSNEVDIHVFDHGHDNWSYLQETEKCQEIFQRQPTLQQMPLDDRKFVAGFGDNSGYFGRMFAAGNYKNMIIERPGEISPILDAIPVQGVPTEGQVTNYLTAAAALKGVGFATATRLLIAKRPDRFLPVNNANRDRIKKIFGSAPGTPDRYLRLLKGIWSMPWFNSPEPDNVHERRVWRARVAILDAVMYDAK